MQYAAFFSRALLLPSGGAARLQAGRRACLWLEYAIVLGERWTRYLLYEKHEKLLFPFRNRYLHLLPIGV